MVGGSQKFLHIPGHCIVLLHLSKTLNISGRHYRASSANKTCFAKIVDHRGGIERNGFLAVTT